MADSYKMLSESEVVGKKIQACPVCGIFLAEPYIKCADCRNPSWSFCLQCFSKGREYENHKNFHSYFVVKNNFTLLDPAWTANEELKLLNGIADHGLGNWSEVSKDVATKTKTECEDHYFNCYIDKPVDPLPQIQPQSLMAEVHHRAPVSCTYSFDPPRPVVASSLYQEMAGYMPARGDFSYEHDNFAELDIKELTFEDDDQLWNELQTSVVDIYQSRLKERTRRKLFLKEYGLLNLKSNVEDSKRYTPLGNIFLDHMKPLMHLFTAESYYKFLEGHLWEHKTKQRIQLLQQCREAGITRQHSIQTFLKLKKRREAQKKTKTTLDEVLSQIKDESSCHNYLRRQLFTASSLDGGSGRRAAPPIDIATMPGFENLTVKEKELCSSLRIMPSSFLKYKSILLNEYRKIGHLRLANARSVIKIDVNKTRKIYDLLLEEGLISKD